MIYFFTVVTTEPTYIFIIPVKSDDYDEENEVGLLARLKFEYTPKYPEETPLIDFDSAEGMDESQQQALLSHLKSQVSLYFVFLKFI